MCLKSNPGKNISGSGVALVTPMDENQNLDLESLQRLTNHVVKNGINYIVALGTTSEAATLSLEEKKQVLQVIKKSSRGKVPIVLSVGGNHTLTIIQEARYLKFDEYSALLSVCPYYVKPSQNGLYEHYKKLSQELNIPIILYNVPGRTGVNLRPETCLALAQDFENIFAVKEACGNITQFWEIIQNSPKGFKVISGDDGSTLASTFLGGEGAISVLAQAFPEKFSAMIQYAKHSDTQSANEINKFLYPFVPLIFEEGNPVGIKSLLKTLGIIRHDQTRLPLIRASQNLSLRIKNKVKC